MDDRKWIEYNEKLVKRVKLYFDLDFIRNWNKNTAEMNRDKRGRYFIVLFA